MALWYEPGVSPMAWRKVSMKALAVAHPHRRPVSVTLAPAASSIVAWNTRMLVRHCGKVTPNSAGKSRASVLG